MESNRTSYLRSLTEELTSQARRVRDLIGGRHWYYDGHHKEFLLVELLRRHVPTGFLVSRGFVVGNVENGACSREQDILIVDTQVEAPLFNQGDVIICFPHTVRAAISVKTTMSKESIVDSLESLTSVRLVASSDCDLTRIWNGAFFMETSQTISNDPSYVHKYVDDYLKETASAAGESGPELLLALDMMADSTNLLFRTATETAQETAKTYLHAYSCNGVATAAFLSSVLDHLAECRLSSRNSFGEFSQTTSVDHLFSKDLYV